VTQIQTEDSKVLLMMLSSNSNEVSKLKPKTWD